MISVRSIPTTWLSSEESQVESSEYQDDADIHHQSFPESVSEERDIHTDYNGCHHHSVKHASYLSAHFSTQMVSGDLVPMPEGCANRAGIGKPLHLAAGRETDARARGWMVDDATGTYRCADFT